MSDIDWTKIIEEDGDPFEIKDSINKSISQTPETRMQEKFEEINVFIDKNNRLPQQSSNILESQLYYRLQDYNSDIKKQSVLKPFDRHNILNIKEEDITSIDNNEINNLFDDDDDIFILKHVKSNAERQKTDFIAKRKPCKDFDNYEHLFKQCQSELKTGERQLAKFDEEQIEEGRFFIVHGLMVYVNKLFDIQKVQRSYENKKDGRTHLIFENGTESNMRFRSLCKRLYENGFYVSRSKQEINSELNKMAEIKIPTGKVYVLKSLSKNEQLKNYNDIYKIGFTTTTVESRIKNAQNETAYLMAPVKIAAVFDTFDMNTQKFEDILHKFFSVCQVNIDVYDNNGTRHTAREWYQIPLTEIEKAVKLFDNGEIVNYKYDRNLKRIVRI